MYLSERSGKIDERKKNMHVLQAKSLRNIQSKFASMDNDFQK